MILRLHLRIKENTLCMHLIITDVHFMATNTIVTINCYFYMYLALNLNRNANSATDVSFMFNLHLCLYSQIVNYQDVRDVVHVNI